MMARALGALLLCALLGAPALAQPAAPAPRPAIPYKLEKQGADGLAWPSVAGLVLASLAAYGIVLGLKKMKLVQGGPLGRERRVKLLESTRLSRRSVLHVVNYHGEELLLAESEHGIALVSSHAAKESTHA